MADAGLRAGAARRRVIDVLAEDGQCLISPRQILDGLASRGQPGSQASVYRVLDEMTGLGLLNRAVDDQGSARYEIHDPQHHHHHVIDEDTGRVDAFHDDDLEEAIHRAAARLGIELTGHDVVLKGRRPPGRRRTP